MTRRVRPLDEVATLTSTATAIFARLLADDSLTAPTVDAMCDEIVATVHQIRAARRERLEVRR